MVDQQSHSNNAPEHRLPTDESDDHKRHRAYQLVVPYYSCSNSMVQNNIVRWFGLVWILGNHRTYVLRD